MVLRFPFARRPTDSSRTAYVEVSSLAANSRLLISKDMQPELTIMLRGALQASPGSESALEPPRLMPSSGN
jgi:hypothetical protein